MKQTLPSYLQEVIRYDGLHYGLRDVTPHERRQRSRFAPVVLATTIPMMASALLLPWWGTALVLALSVVFILGVEKRSHRITRQNHDTEMGLVPASENENLRGAHDAARLFRDARSNKKFSLEVRELAETGEDLLRNYEDVLQAWALTLWKDQREPDLEEALASEARRLQKEVHAHAATLQDLLDWEIQQENAPPKIALSPETVLSRSRQNAAHSQTVRTSVQKKIHHQQEALADLSHPSFFLHGSASTPVRGALPE